MSRTRTTLITGWVGSASLNAGVSADRRFLHQRLLHLHHDVVGGVGDRHEALDAVGEPVPDRVVGPAGFATLLERVHEDDTRWPS